MVQQHGGGGTESEATGQQRKPRHPWNPSTRLRATANKTKNETVMARAPANAVVPASNSAAHDDARRRHPHSASGTKRDVKHNKAHAQKSEQQEVRFMLFAAVADVGVYLMDATYGVLLRGNRIQSREEVKAMIERAVSFAFMTDQTSFEEDDGDARDSIELMLPGHNKENRPQGEQLRVRESGKQTHFPSTATLVQKLQATVDATSVLRQTQAHRQEVREQHAHEDVIKAKCRQEFHKQRQAAAFEYQQRKLAVQALQARIECEIQYLRATAEDLTRREQLLDDAFENYEHMLRLEFGIGDEHKHSG
ncbi:hypothetical protein FI667_g486, partial [Globisporangium splendens]